MPRPDRLAKQFVDSAVELYRRRLWTEVPGDAVFLVTVPTVEDPLVTNVMGQDGQEYGLGIVRGEGAFRAVARMYTDSAATPRPSRRRATS